MHASAIFSAPKSKKLNQHKLFMRKKNKVGCGCPAMLMFTLYPGDTRGHWIHGQFSPYWFGMMFLFVILVWSDNQITVIMMLLLSADNNQSTKRSPGSNEPVQFSAFS